MAQGLGSSKQYNTLLSSAKSLSDPISQTFEIKPEHCREADGCYITSVDLFFAEKDDNLGVNIDLRTTENGAPTRIILPHSKVHLESEAVKTSNDGTVLTRVVFKCPVYVKAGRRYAVTIRPDGQVPTYKVFVSKLGNVDLSSGETIVENWGDGAFYTSLSGAWSPQSDIDLTFRVNRAQFDLSASPTITYTNDDYEFFTVEDTNGFLENEYVYKFSTSNFFNAGKVSIVASDIENGDPNMVNKTITGTGTNFRNYNVNDKILMISDEDSSKVVIATIKSIESATEMTAESGFEHGFTIGSHTLTPTALLTSVEESELVLTDSTASNNSFKFEAGDVIKGVESQSGTTITSVDNVIINHYLPQISRCEPARTRVETEARFRKSDSSDTVTKTIAYGMQNKISDCEVAVYSKSNEINSNDEVVKSLQITSELSFTPTCAPSIDIDSSCLYTFNNEIDNVNDDERKDSIGSAKSKYISRVVTLAPGIDSNDIEVFLTAYRPEKTTIEVYARVINDADGSKSSQRQWTKLSQPNNQEQLYSSTDNQLDFKEYRYFIPKIPTINDQNKQPGTANTTTDSADVTLADASQYYETGDLIVLGSSTTDYFVGRVSSANTTAVTLYETSDRDRTNINHYKVNEDEEQSAFRFINSAGSEKLNYYDSNGIKHDNFSQFQIKIVLLAEQTYSVPKIQDMRAIALS